MLRKSFFLFLFNPVCPEKGPAPFGVCDVGVCQLFPPKETGRAPRLHHDVGWHVFECELIADNGCSYSCLTCRRRKTRCAGERPLCSTCTKNRHECLGYPEDKKETGDAADGRSASREGDTDGQNGDGSEDGDPQEPERPAKKTKISAPDHVATPASTAAQKADVQAQAIKGAKSVEMVSQPSPVAASPPVQPQPPPVDEMGPESPAMRRGQIPHDHRIPYFRYFGPTAIVPGYKQMVVSVRDRRWSNNASNSPTSPVSNPSGKAASSTAAESDVIIEEPPSYDPSDPAPVHPLIISLAKTFFTHMGCNYPFLNQRKFMREVKEKRAEGMLVDAVCALAARFSDSPILTGGNSKMARTERGQVFAQRAKQATVDTFPCPSVGAVQACLLMAYEGFGANQDSALWMYLGLAIRMAVDLGLSKVIGTQYQGDKDPSNTRREPGSPELRKDQSDLPSQAEQREMEQERIDTFWAVFILDRVISSGTGRPVTLRDDDFELAFPGPSVDPATNWPTPFPTLIEIIHLYGRVCDVLNNVHDLQDLTQDKWQKLNAMETQLTKVYRKWDARLHFSVNNFKVYLGIGQGTTFILLHLWFHALFIILHQPTLMTPLSNADGLQLLSDSRELSMSSAKTICDILAFADLIDPNSFIGNPFTNQPIYIAACAFLMESSIEASADSSRECSPPRQTSAPSHPSRQSRHSLLASVTSQNYQRCYSSLEQIHAYWGGVKYVMTALDQKAKGIWDCETYTSEEYEATKKPAANMNSLNSQFNFGTNPMSPKAGGPPIAWSLSGTANSPNSSLTLMYQNCNPMMTPSNTHTSTARTGSTPPGGMSYDASRLERGGLYPPPFPQAHTSAVRASPRISSLAGQNQQQHMGEGSKMFMTPAFTPGSNHSNNFEYSASPASTMAESSARQSHMYYPSNMSYQTSWGGSSNMDAITFDSQDIDIGALGLQQPELMGPWLDSIPGDLLGLFENHDMQHNGQSEQ